MKFCFQISGGRDFSKEAGPSRRDRCTNRDIKLPTPHSP